MEQGNVILAKKLYRLGVDTVDIINTMEFIKRTEKLIVKSFFMNSQCNKIE